MKFLLDTHVVLWANLTPNKLSDAVRDLILDPKAAKCVSIISFWEVAIKLGTGKLRIDGGLPTFCLMVDDNGFDTLGVERGSIALLKDLPPIHRDPFDRLLIATAISEGLTLVTFDGNIQKYDVLMLW